MGKLSDLCKHVCKTQSTVWTDLRARLYLLLLLLLLLMMINSKDTFSLLVTAADRARIRHIRGIQIEPPHLGKWGLRFLL